MNAHLRPNTAVLPDGNRVVVSLTKEPWWEQDNASGYVRPDMLAPDPQQPRKHMNADKLAELRESVAASGVRQAIVVTPLSKAPWAVVAPEHARLPFLIVAGHRRDKCALESHLGAVPIMVRVYASEKEHHMDRSLLNYGHEDLSEIEQGWEAVALRDEGWKIEELCERFGIQAPGLYARMNLTKLAPELQHLLDPKLPIKKRLGTTLGGALGGVKQPTPKELVELLESFSDIVSQDDIIPEGPTKLDDTGRRFALQRMLFEVIHRRSLPSERAVEFVHEQAHTLLAAQTGNTGAPVRRYEPHRRREILAGLVKSVQSSVVVDWKPEEFRRIFEYEPYESLEAVIKSYQAIADFFLGVIKILKTILATKKPTHPDVLKLHDRK